MKLKGIIFDLDGTVVDVPYNWNQIKKELKTQGEPILYFLSSLKEPERSAKWKLLEKYENEATLRAVLKEGIQEFLDFLAQAGIKKALVTNNSRKNVSYLLDKFNLKFECIISRESGLWKPSGVPLFAALKKLEIKREESCVIGDSHFDIQAAADAGISKVFILNKDKKKFTSFHVEVFSSVETLKKRIEDLILEEK